MIKQPQNLFSTKHFWGVLFTFYVAAISPAIDKAINSKLTSREIADILNSLIVAAGTASLKLLDEDIYTSEGLPGKNKEEAIKNCNSILTPMVIKEVEPIITNILTKEVEPFTTNEVTSTITKESTSIETSTSTSTTIDTSNMYKLICIVNTWLKTKPIDHLQLAHVEIQEALNNSTYLTDSYEKVENNHLRVSINNKTWYVYIPHIKLYKDEVEIKLVELIEPTESTYTGFIPTREQCNSIYNTELRDNEYTDLVNCLKRFNINTKLDVAHFLSQTAHESGGLRYMKEIGDYEYFSKNYDYRDDLGNYKEGDGAKYCGSGVIGLTGRANYQAFSDYIGDPRVMEGADYVADTLPFTSGGYFWFREKISDYINYDKATVEQVTLVINGGYNGLEERKAYFTSACQVLDI